MRYLVQSRVEEGLWRDEGYLTVPNNVHVEDVAYEYLKEVGPWVASVKKWRTVSIVDEGTFDSDGMPKLMED